jgi:hypothetical protein
MASIITCEALVHCQCAASAQQQAEPGSGTRPH